MGSCTGIAMLAAALALAAPIRAEPAVPPASTSATIEVGFDNVRRLTADRYRARAPGRHARRVAELDEVLGSGLRLDPVVTAGAERALYGAMLAANTRGEFIPYDEALFASAEQGTPFGTRLTLSGSALPFASASVGLSQDLLRNGPLHGLSQLDLARHQHRAAALAADIEYQLALQRVLSTLVEAQRARLDAEAAARALAQARTQQQAVQQLVASGYKPKSDLLFSRSLEIRAELREQRARAQYLNRCRDLAVALWQGADDPPLQVATALADDALLQRVLALRGDSEAPSVARARAQARAAHAQAELAERDTLPGLSVQGRVTRMFEVPEDQGTAQSVGIALSVPLVSSFTRESAERGALLARSADDAMAHEQQRLQARLLELRALLQVNAADLEARRELLRLAEQAFAIEQQKYADGKTTINELTRVQSELDQAGLEVHGAASTLLLTGFELARELGQLEQVLP